jgi:hypothetical protein
MKTYIKEFLAITLLCSIPSSALSVENAGQNKTSKYINVTIEIHGLEESVEYLKNASVSLAETMEELQNKKGELTTEDLERIERIASSMEAMTEKIDKTLLSLGPTIQQAREPTVELLSAIVKDTKVEAIDPVVASVQSKVSESVNEIKWSLVTVGAVFLLAIIVLGLFLFKIFKEMNGIATTIHNAFQRGEFIFRPRDENA